MEKLKITELRKLPHRKWDEIKSYRSLLLINSGRKHDSGYALMYIIGIGDDGKPLEIAAFCDDISWIIKNTEDYRYLRTDCFYPSGILRFWSNNFKFEVGESLSSVDIKLIKKE